MLFEQLLLLALAGVSFFMIILPIFRFIKPFVLKEKKDPLKEARIRLEVAKAEAEAAKLNKQAEEVYNKLYEETLEEDSDLDKHNRV